MAYDEKLFKRVDEIAKGKRNFFKIKMFGGVGYLLKGNMCFGLYQNYLILRLGETAAKKALKKKHVKEFDITGRPMKGWVMVADKGPKTKESLNQWLNLALKFVAKIPPK